jgi:transcription initiation factor TFIID TATA-box-binding protein
MRKRKYVQSNDQIYCHDYLIESIEEYRMILTRKSLPDSEFYSDSDIDSCSDFKKSKHDIPKTIIHNLVGTSRIEMGTNSLDLKGISESMPNSSYDKQKFAAITIRLQTPLCTVLLFSSGKMVITGCKTYVQTITAGYEIVLILQQIYPHKKINLSEVVIQNIVGNTDIRLQENEYIDLEDMTKKHNIYCTYLKNMFPGLIYRPRQSPVVLLIFLSGKIVITGGKSCHDVEYGWQKLYPIVKQFVKKHNHD